MKKNIVRLAGFGLLAAAIALAPTQGFAQEKKKEDSTEKSDAPKKEKKKRDGLPANGKVAAIDKAAQTIKVGENTYQVNSETRIRKAGKDAPTLDDAVVGEEVGIYYKEVDGKRVALSLRFGPRPDDATGGNGEKKKKKKE